MPKRRAVGSADRSTSPTQQNFFAVFSISVLVLVVALYTILSSQFDSSTKKWAFGAVGVILGRWLHA